LRGGGGVDPVMVVRNQSGVWKGQVFALAFE